MSGLLLGDGVFGVIDVPADDPIVGGLAEVALFSVLFADGMRAGLDELRSERRLPGRALALGLPLTLTATAVLAHVLAGLPWQSRSCWGPLSPTDAVFAGAIVGLEGIPYRLRDLLNVESGLNDGLGLQVVVVLLAVVGPETIHAVDLGTEVLAGVALGIGVPVVAIRLERSRFFNAAIASSRSTRSPSD